MFPLQYYCLNLCAPFQPVPAGSAFGLVPPAIVAGPSPGIGGAGGYYMTRPWSRSELPRREVDDRPFDVWPKELIVTRQQHLDRPTLDVALPGDIPAERAMVLYRSVAQTIEQEDGQRADEKRVLVEEMLRLTKPGERSLIDLLWGETPLPDLRKEIVGEILRLALEQHGYERARTEQEHARSLAAELLQPKMPPAPAVAEEMSWLGSADSVLPAPADAFMTWVPAPAPMPQPIVVAPPPVQRVWPLVVVGALGIAIGVAITIWLSESPPTAASPQRRKLRRPPPRPGPSTPDPTAPTSPRVRRGRSAHR